MNEELQSTNEELQTMNDELRTRSVELELVERASSNRSSRSLRAGVVVLDRDLRVRSGTSGAEDLWGVRGDEAVGSQFLTLDIGLPVADLAQSIRTVINGEQTMIEKTMSSLTRRGRTIDCLSGDAACSAAAGRRE